jgi:translation initiation factor 2B subunit (eIF-2B alpha/beta/delta family)
VIARRRLLAFPCGLLASIARAGITPAEQARIDRLIDYIESRKDLTFIRNGSEYSCEDAARFMRRKLRSMGENVTTAQQFIEQIASKSSTTGKPYLIRYADGKTVTAAVFLGEELKRMDGKN